MEPVSAIAGAIIAGASFALHETSAVAVREAYNGVKTILVDVYNFLSFPLLERNLTAKTYRAAFEQELQDHEQILHDKKLLAALDSLTRALKSVPPDTAAAYGLQAEDITAYEHVILQRISSIRAGNLTAQSGSVVITDVGNQRGN